MILFLRDGVEHMTTIFRSQEVFVWERIPEYCLV